MTQQPISTESKDEALRRILAVVVDLRTWQSHANNQLALILEKMDIGTEYLEEEEDEMDAEPDA